MPHRYILDEIECFVFVHFFTIEVVPPTGRLSNEQISQIAEQTLHMQLNKIAIECLGFRFSDLNDINQGHLSWFAKKFRIIETWRDKDPAEHNAAVSNELFLL